MSIPPVKIGVISDAKKIAEKLAHIVDKARNFDCVKIFFIYKSSFITFGISSARSEALK